MSNRPNDLQKAVVARLLADAGVIATHASAATGPAVFARGQPFDQVFPRSVIEPPQSVPVRGVETDVLFVTFHSFASGADATLVAAAAANAVREALDAPLSLAAFTVATQTFEASTPVGDPDDTVEHVVSTFRFVISRPA